MSTSKKVLKIVGKIALYLFLIAIMFLMIFPIAYAFIASFKTNSEILTATNIFPKEPTFDNYIQAWKVGNFSRYTWNSVYMTFFVVIGTIITSTMTGYVFARGNFPGKKLLFSLFTSTMFISMGTIGLYPILDIAKAMHINTTLWGVIIIQVFGVNMFNTFLIRGYMESIPRSVDEAATIDGCGFFGIYYKIIFPLLKPVIATIALMTFMGSWNNYMLPMVFTINNLDQAPLTVGIVALKNSGTVASQWNIMLAGTMISIVPLLIVYLFLNKYFISGMTSGAVKE